MTILSKFLLFIGMGDNESTSDSFLNLEVGSLLHIELLDFHEKFECNKLWQNLWDLILRQRNDNVWNLTGELDNDYTYS